MIYLFRIGIIIWVLNEIFDLQKFFSWDDLKMEIYEMILKRIFKELVRWEEK